MLRRWVVLVPAEEVEEVVGRRVLCSEGVGVGGREPKKASAHEGARRLNCAEARGSDPKRRR